MYYIMYWDERDRLLAVNQEFDSPGEAETYRKTLPAKSNAFVVFPLTDLAVDPEGREFNGKAGSRRPKSVG